MRKVSIGVTKAEAIGVAALLGGLIFATFLSHHLRKDDWLTISYFEWCRAILLSVGMGAISVIAMAVNVWVQSKQRDTDSDNKADRSPNKS